MKKKSIFVLLTAIILVLSTAFFVITVVPRASQQEQLFISTGEGQLSRKMVLTIPKEVWLGSESSVQMDLEVTDQTNLLPDDKKAPANNQVIEGRLDLPSVAVDPDGSISTPLTANTVVHFSWRIIPLYEGEYSGNFWLYLNDIPVSNGEMMRRALLAHEVNIKVISFLGIPYIYLVWGSGVGMILSLVSLALLRFLYR